MAYPTCSIDVGKRRAGPQGGRVRRRRGFSVAEALTASVILAVAVVGIAGPLTAAGEQARVSQENSTAAVLARELMEEIASKPLLDGGTTCHLGPETAAGETTRANFDSADDYHGYHDGSSDMTTLGGTRLSIAPGYSRDVTVEYRATPSGASASSGDFGLVTVCVTTPHKQVVKISRLLAKQRTAT